MGTAAAARLFAAQKSRGDAAPARAVFSVTVHVAFISLNGD
jgi:hypothetical protein